MGYYDCEELKKAYIANRTAENLANLAEWFDRYGDEYWNGEKWDAEDFYIRPIMKYDENLDIWETIGYEEV